MSDAVYARSNAHSHSDADNAHPELIDCELCVLGTGIAGLNALYAATYYLPKTTRVVVIDKNRAVGGMWQNTYPYVRLHQPHPFFTVGDIPWKLKKDKSYLASRTEIIEHLSDCYAQICDYFEVVELFESEFERHEEFTDGVRVFVNRNQDIGSEVVEVRAKQLIKAKGFNIKPNEPFALSSQKVESCNPETLNLDSPSRKSETLKPAYVIGGGKTAMDTALALIRENPSRPVHLIAGKGTWFLRRETFFPTGIRRYWTGAPLSQVNRVLAEKFDGDNAQECLDYFKQNGGISLQDDFQYFVLGILSQEENEALENGLASIVTDYLEDVIDTDDGPSMVFRNSPPQQVDEGAIFINCSGYIVRDRPKYEPFLSPGKRVLSIQSSSSAIVFTTYSSYFLTHMFFRNKLEGSGLYELNYHTVDKKNKQLLAYVASTHLIYNFTIFMEHLPLSVMAKCHLNLDLWFPKPRQWLAMLSLMLRKNYYKQHCKQALDRFEAIYQANCRPLTHTIEDEGLHVAQANLSANRPTSKQPVESLTE